MKQSSAAAAAMEESRRMHGDEIRHLVCQKFSSGELLVEIAEELQMNYFTVSSIVNLYLQEGRIESVKKRAPKRKKLGPDEEAFIQELVREDCSITLQEIQRRLSEERSVNVSLMTIQRAFSGFEYSLKQVALVPAARNTDEAIEDHYNYAVSYMQLSESTVVFVDEMGIHYS